MHSPAPPKPTLLQVRSLGFAWPGCPVLQGLSFDLPTGLSLVTGEEGCGKSTLLRLLAGQQRADAGHIRLADSTLHPQDAGWREQVFWIDPWTTAHDTRSATAYWLSVQREYPTFSTEALGELVHGLGLQPHVDKPLHMLSTGSKRKVWLASAFAAGTRLTLIDQPFAALDAPATRFVCTLLQAVADHPHRAWLLADHSPPPGVSLALTLRL